MSSSFSRILQMAGWAIVGLTVLLLIAANHIDRYEPPQTDTPALHK
ncbi:division septum protein Blr [Superficieibacter sp. HKU1]|nr:division septum protein Blr [Superficieibacter sp. HKU1]WES66340.1 division septum protein Blr [Superficieibacter sp. HKU1]